jgi:hypothetical protein
MIWSMKAWSGGIIFRPKLGQGRGMRGRDIFLARKMAPASEGQRERSLPDRVVSLRGGICSALVARHIFLLVQVVLYFCLAMVGEITRDFFR